MINFSKIFNLKIPISIFIIFAFIGCKTTKQFDSISNTELTVQLEEELDQVKNLKLNISNQISDKNDFETPYRILVEESKAEEFKKRITEIYQSNSNRKLQLDPLKTIIESCEKQESKWDEYCFKKMPWFGVEPILSVWIKAVKETIQNVK